MQDLSLNIEFTIQETFLYFGWVNGMNSEEIGEKLQFLLKFLQLPPADRFIKTLRLEPGVVCRTKIFMSFTLSNVLAYR
jgi:ABC-type Na+ transport system ATPase subunit NatA